MGLGRGVERAESERGPVVPGSGPGPAGAGREVVGSITPSILDQSRERRSFVTPENNAVGFPASWKCKASPG